MHYWRADNCTTPGCPFVGNHAFASEFPRPNSGGQLFPNHTDTEFFLTPSRGEAAGGYGLNVAFKNGSTAVFAHREEPKVLLEWSDSAGDYVPTHLFNVVIEKQMAPKDGWQHLESYILAQPLAGDMQPVSTLSNQSFIRRNKREKEG
jgi:hypothetical protein